MKIVFFGNEKLATGLSDTRPLIRQAVQAAGFEIEQSLTEDLTKLNPHEAKLAVLAAYGYLVPKSILDEFPLGIINIHPSLLPQYRGPTPIEQAILDGTDKTGVSIMRLAADMDEGPVYKQKAVQLTGAETKTELAERLQKLGADLLLDVLPAIANGKLKPRAQPHPERATYTSKLTKSDGVIDWRKPANRLEREVRAYEGWPKSRTKLGNLEFEIIKAKPIIGTGPLGKPFLIDKYRLCVYSGQGALEIIKLKPAGKKEMTAKEFLAGYKNRLNL